jgi:hypothetical protein
MTPAIRTILLGQRPWSFRDWFRSGEQGAVYEADNPADGGPVTAYQESTGITPVTAPGQGAADCVIGFLVDKRLGGRNALGAEAWDDTATTFTGASSKVSANVYRVYSAAGALSYVAGPTTVANKAYEVLLTVDSIAAAGSGVQVGLVSGGGSAIFTTTGAKRCIAVGDGTAILVKRVSGAAATDYQISGVSVRELPGNHATQATTASKPVLSARYNLLTQTEAFDNAVWTKSGTLAFGAGSVTNTTATLDPLGGNTAEKLVEDSSTGSHQIYQQPAALPSISVVKFTTYIKAAGRTSVEFGGNWIFGSIVVNLTTGAVTGVSAAKCTTTDAGNGWWKVVFTDTTPDAASRSYVIRLHNGVSDSYTGDGTSGIYLWGADLRTSADAALSIPAYQRVTDASNYDTAGFPCRIKFDGFDDSLQTAAVDFTGTDKMTVVAGLTKFSDAALGAVCELSVGVTVNNAFALFAPVSAAANYSSISRGTATSQTITANVFAAPRTDVVTMVADIAGDTNTLRVNGAATLGASDQGTGNYGSFALTVGRRGAGTGPLNAYLTRLIIRGAATPDSQITKAERSTAKRMALTY